MAFSLLPIESAIKSFDLTVSAFSAVSIITPEAGDRIGTSRPVLIEWVDPDPLHTSWEVSYSTNGVLFTTIGTTSNKWIEWIPPAYFRAVSLTIKVEFV